MHFRFFEAGKVLLREMARVESRKHPGIAHIVENVIMHRPNVRRRIRVRVLSLSDVAAPWYRMQ